MSVAKTKKKAVIPKEKNIKEDKLDSKIIIEEKPVSKKRQKLPMCKMSRNIEPMIIDPNDNILFWKNINLR